MLCGGLSPFPLRFGGGNRRLQRIVESLAKARGTAYDVTQPSNLYPNIMATARLLNASWATNASLGFLWDAARTPALARWEAMLALPVSATDTEQDRRNRLAAVFAKIGQAVTENSLSVQLQAALGPVFVSVDFLSTTVALQQTSPGWFSNVAHVLIRVQTPAGYQEVDFQNAVAKIFGIMDAQAPAWVTWDWYRPGPTPIPVTGGPSAGGFFLDDTHNLDNEVFDV